MTDKKYVTTYIDVNIDYDPVKRNDILRNRGLDFADVAKVFENPVFTQKDDRFDYPEPRFQTYGLLNDRLIMFVWTPIKNGLRVI